MPRKATATATQADDVTAPQTRLVPLSDLYLHPLNPRQEPPEAEIEALAASIKAVGLLQNLSGFADHQIRFRLGHQDGNPDHIGIVAGGRRLRALQLLAASGDWQVDVPVNITTDADLAGQWAGAENETQRGLSVVDRITAYAQMREKGHSQEAIASAFAKPIGDVRRLLALATLPDAALSALRAEKISLDIARHLTAARTAEDLEAALQSALLGKSEWQIRDMLRRETVSSKDPKALYVGLEAYEAAGGGYTRDLFADDAILHDRTLLQQLADTKAEAHTEQLRQSEDWLWAQYVADGNPWNAETGMRRIYAATVPLPQGDAERLAELEDIDETDLTETEIAELEDLRDRAKARAFADQDRATGGILTHIDNTGKLKVYGTYRRKQDEPRAEGDDGSIHINRPAESSMPQNLKDDLRKIRLICIQDALRRDEVLCHDLLALQLSRRLFNWAYPFDLTQTHATPPSKPDGMTIPAALAEPDAADHNTDPAPVVTEWLRSPSGQTIHAAVYNGLARAFVKTDGPIVDAINTRQPINARSLWTPNAGNFFGRVSAGYLDALWRELVPDEGSRHAGFEGLPKKEKVKELDRLFSDWNYRETLGLSREVNAKIDAWLPEELRFAAPDEEGEE